MCAKTRLRDFVSAELLGKVVYAAPIAQSAERLHGKEKVKGSIPFRGSVVCHGSAVLAAAARGMTAVAG